MPLLSVTIVGVKREQYSMLLRKLADTIDKGDDQAGEYVQEDGCELDYEFLRDASGPVKSLKEMGM